MGHWAIRDSRMYLIGFSPGHMGYASIYAQELHLKVEHGVVTKRRVRDNRERQLDLDRIDDLALPGTHNLFDRASRR